MFACLVACLRGRQWEKVARVFVLCVQVVRLCARQGVCVWMVDGMRARVDAMPCVCVCVYARPCGVCYCVACGGGGGVYVCRCDGWCVWGDETRRAG